VNADKPGVVEEKIYEPSFDPELFLRMPAEELEERSSEILGSFPNAYAFTKNMAEHILQTRALKSDASDSKLPLVICRPSIIGCSWKDPQPGWVDAVLTLGAVMLAGGLGVIQFFRADPTKIFDLVPLDTVVDATLASAACMESLAAADNSVPVVNIGSSAIRPLKLWKIIDSGSSYFQAHPSTTKQVRRCNVKIDPDPDSKAFEKDIASLKFRGAVLKKIGRTGRTGKLLQKACDRTIMLDSLFHYFATQEWIFQASNLLALPSLLERAGEPAEYGSLVMDNLDWNHYIQLYCYGLRRFVLHEEDAFYPTEPTENASWHADDTSSSDEVSSSGSPDLVRAGCFPRSQKDASSGCGNCPSWIRRAGRACKKNSSRWPFFGRLAVVH
jgi:fatty acyl-CoA reductase